LALNPTGFPVGFFLWVRLPGDVLYFHKEKQEHMFTFADHRDKMVASHRMQRRTAWKD
jgi:hypothetical protein